MKRHQVYRSSRIVVTENLIKTTQAQSVLEIGAGDFSFDYLASQTQDWQKVDFEPPCDIVCDLNREDVYIPIQDQAFDLVICTQVMEHLLWPHRLLEETKRILAPGGKILISVPNISSLSYRFAWLVGRLPSCAASGNLPIELGSTAYQSGPGTTIGGHVIDFNRQRLDKLLQYAGFHIEKICGSGIIWHKQILPPWLVPVAWSSDIICLAKK